MDSPVLEFGTGGQGPRPAIVHEDLTVYKTSWAIGSRKLHELNTVLRSRNLGQNGMSAGTSKTAFGLKMKSKPVLKHVLILFSLSSVIGCASSPKEPGSGSLADEPAGSDCISQGSVRDYRVLDDANLIVTAAVRKKYHVVLSRKAMSLQSSHAIGFDTTTSRICSKFSDLIVEGSFGPERIRIVSVRHLTPEDENDLLVRFGKKEPEYEGPRQTEEVDGAEVEELD